MWPPLLIPNLHSVLNFVYTLSELRTNIAEDTSRVEVGFTMQLGVTASSCKDQKEAVELV